MQQVDESNNGQEVEVPIGQTFELRLQENPTTGYKWNLKSNGAPQCALIDDAFETKSDSPQQPGRGGAHAWQFRAAENGETHIQLAYERGWQKDATPRTFTLKVHVTGNS